MRGSLRKQISAALKKIFMPGSSRHQAKLENNGRSPYIHSIGTFEQTLHRLQPLAEWLQQRKILNIEELNSIHVKEYLEHRLLYHIEHGNCRQSFKVEVSALGSLARALTAFSVSIRTIPVVYDFDVARLAFTQQAKQNLRKFTSQYNGRALPRPEEMIDALQLCHHKFMTSLQLYAGCRTEGVGAPQRPVPGGNRLTIANFQDSEGRRLPVQSDPLTGKPVQIFWTKEKGGKIATKYCPVALFEHIYLYISTHPEGLGDEYKIYLHEINKAMKLTHQAVPGRGTHALRFNFAQRRMIQCMHAGMHDEEAKRFVSIEMSHNRPDITEGYYR
jgi:hypothetical protein